MKIKGEFFISLIALVIFIILLFGPLIFSLIYPSILSLRHDLHIKKLINLENQNISISQEEEILNQIYNEEISLINNITTNNG